MSADDASRSFDFAIVGAGIVGAAVAHFLAPDQGCSWAPRRMRPDCARCMPG